MQWRYVVFVAYDTPNRSQGESEQLSSSPGHTIPADKDMLNALHHGGTDSAPQQDTPTVGNDPPASDEA